MVPLSISQKGMVIVMENREKLAVVICNYNKGSCTVDCIASVLASDLPGQDSIRIIVVDNASDDGSETVITKAYGDEISFTRSDVDLGSCGGLNLGIEQALNEGFEYICCLGEEITVAPDALKVMRNYMASNPSTGLVGGKVYHGHMPHYIQQFGISSLTSRRFSTPYTACAAGLPTTASWTMMRAGLVL